MGNVSSATNFSDSQLEDLSGGPVLQSVSMPVAAQVSKKPPRKLSEHLHKGVGAGSLVVPLYLLIVQQVDASLYEDADALSVPPLKVRGECCEWVAADSMPHRRMCVRAYSQVITENFDMVMDTLTQFSEFVSANVPVAQLAMHMPSLQDLVQVYRVPPTLALFMAQPILNHLRMQCIEAAGKGQEAPAVAAEFRAWESQVSW